MSIILSFSSIRNYKAERDPTSSDFAMLIQTGEILAAETGNLWQNTLTNNLFQCVALDPGVSATWSLKPALSEGTFVPSIEFSDTSAGITYAGGGRQGLYTRIGSVVYINIFIRLTSLGSASGDATITGLPFPARSGISPKGLDVILAFGGDIELRPDMKGRVNAGSSIINLVDVFKDPLLGVLNATDLEFRDNSILQVDGFYYI